jgi:hypothetical protein
VGLKAAGRSCLFPRCAHPQVTRTRSWHPKFASSCRALHLVAHGGPPARPSTNRSSVRSGGRNSPARQNGGASSSCGQDDTGYGGLAARPNIGAEEIKSGVPWKQPADRPRVCRPPAAPQPGASILRLAPLGAPQVPKDGRPALGCAVLDRNQCWNRTCLQPQMLRRAVADRDLNVQAVLYSSITISTSFAILARVRSPELEM